MSTITSASILIDVLGGNHKVAAITGSRPSAVSNWRKGKLPAATYVILRTKIERMGLQVRDELWAMRTKPRTIKAQKMKTNATTSIWRTTPLLDARFHELLKATPKLTYTAIAMRLSVEFSVHITKNACIGHGRRSGVPKRQPPRSYAGRKGRT